MKAAADLLSTILVTIAAAFLLWTQIESRWIRPTQFQALQDVTGLTIPGSQVRHSRGSGNIAFVEFTDYECPYCRSHASKTAPTIDKEFISTGQVRYVMFNFPLEAIHPRAKMAGEAAECAARQGRYWDMHDRLFSAELDLKTIHGFADTLGLNQQMFSRCLEGASSAQISADLAEGRRLGVTSTPTFFTGVVKRDGSIQLMKRVAGAAPAEVLREAIRAASSSRPLGWRRLLP